MKGTERKGNKTVERMEGKEHKGKSGRGEERREWRKGERERKVGHKERDECERGIGTMRG